MEKVQGQKPPLYRIQFELTGEGKRDWDRMKEVFKLKRNKDLLNNALTILEWAAAQILSGRIIASVDEKNEKFRELQMPIFGAVRRKAGKVEPIWDDGKIHWTNQCYVSPEDILC